MKIKFLRSLIIGGKYKVEKGTVLLAEETDSFYEIILKEGVTVKAPKSALGDVFKKYVTEYDDDYFYDFEEDYISI